MITWIVRLFTKDRNALIYFSKIQRLQRFCTMKCFVSFYKMTWIYKAVRFDLKICFSFTAENYYYFHIEYTADIDRNLAI